MRGVPSPPRPRRPLQPTPWGEPARAGRGRHGLSAAQIDAMMRAQGYACATCGRDIRAPGARQVDHSHRLARAHGHSVHVGCARCVGAILCRDCNSALPESMTPETLRRLAEYLTWRESR
jgi:hypothetical protein